MIWGNDNIKNRIVRLQKCAGRLILGAENNTPSVELFKTLRWQNFPERVKFHKALLMYKCMNNIAPVYLSNLFHKNRDILKYHLRSCDTNLLHIPKAKTEIFKHSFSYSGPKIWNSLDVQKRNAVSVDNFKKLYLKAQ